MAGSALLWGLLSGWLQRFNLSAPMAFVALGLISSHGPLAVIHVQIDSSTARSVADASSRKS